MTSRYHQSFKIICNLLKTISKECHKGKGLPPTLIQVADNDVLRDEGEAYGRKLLEAGVKATTVRYNGVIHDFGLLNPQSEIQQTKDLFTQASAQLKQYLK